MNEIANAINNDVDSKATSVASASTRLASECIGLASAKEPDVVIDGNTASKPTSSAAAAST